MKEDVVKKIYNYSLEDIMGERFGRYSKYIIQDRAIPDVRDGLKPVQRRILYGMWHEKVTWDKAYLKSAKIVGNIMGNYHPHGDSSIYEAMVRLSQWWKLNTPYIDMHGNNGSMDGDSPAAMRYTESRLAPISKELLGDIDRSTVDMTPNFDDTELEPIVLPAKFPNLLVNGSTGISAGYATNIPPHNLEEVINGVIKLIDKPDITLDEMMNIIKGPDFPTGGIIEGLDGIKEAYETGKGKIKISSKTSFVETKNMLQLVVTEIPYEVNKSDLVKKIDNIHLDKNFDGILEVRDESDKDGLRIVIDLKKGANKEVVLKYLLKNTDLQINYSINSVAILKERPKQLSLLEMLKAYIEHLEEVIIRRSKFDLEFASKRHHIIEGLIKVMSILDEVIKVIRGSINKSDAKENLVKEFGFTIDQAEAIVTLQLYKLTNTDVIELQREKEKLEKAIALLNDIISNHETLKKVMKDELSKVKKDFASPRKSLIQNEVSDLAIDLNDVIPDENVVLQVSNDGYLKRSSLRSYNALDQELFLKEGDYPLSIRMASLKDIVILFTDLGNYLAVPVINFPNVGWKELGSHVSNIVPLTMNENIIRAFLVSDFTEPKYFYLCTKKGNIKKISLKDLLVSRFTKTYKCFNLDKDDLLIDVLDTPEHDIILGTHNNYLLRMNKEEFPKQGLKTKGVRGIKLKKDDFVIGFKELMDPFLLILFKNHTMKRVREEEIPLYKRASLGVQIVREIKSNPLSLKNIYSTNLETKFSILKSNNDIVNLFGKEIPLKNRYQGGSNIIKGMKEMFVINNHINEEEPLKEVKEERQLSLIGIDEDLENIDNVLKGTND